LTRSPKKYADIKGSLDRGPKEMGSRIADREGEVMDVAERDVAATHPATPIVDVAGQMIESDYRRLPVLDAGSQRLEGMARAIDILDFLGGGTKYNIIGKDFGGNFLAAINCPINKIMGDAQQLTVHSSIADAVSIMVAKRTSLIPIVEDEEDRKVVAVVSERDVLPPTFESGVTVGDVMKGELVTATPGMMLGDVAKVLVRNGYRRLPVESEGHLAGVVTTFDILRYLAEGQFTGVDAEENLSVRASDFMTRDPVTLTPGDELSEVSRLVLETGLGGFPVVDEGKLAGIVTTTDVIARAYGK